MSLDKYTDAELHRELSERSERRKREAHEARIILNNKTGQRDTVTKSKSSKKKPINRRPTLTPADIRDFKFMLSSMRDDRNRLLAADNDEWESSFEAAEALARRILGDDYTHWYR